VNRIFDELPGAWLVFGEWSRSGWRAGRFASSAVLVVKSARSPGWLVLCSYKFGSTHA
jgi:hypothetical protein